MTRILLLRHGHVPGITPKRFRGRLDLELSDAGRAQAAAAAEHVAARYAVGTVYSSPLRRCLDSARALTLTVKLPDPTPLDGINDIDYGSWQGKLATEVQASSPDEYRRWTLAPETVVFSGGESLARVAERAASTLKALAHQHDGTIAVYTHDSVIRVVLLSALAARFTSYHQLEIDPCSLSELVWASDDAI